MVRGRYIHRVRARQGAAAASAFGLALPAAALGLLPVGQRVTLVLVFPPASARRSDGLLVAAVEKLADQIEIPELPGTRAFGQEEYLRPVRVLVAVGEPDRLPVGMPVDLAAIRQETPVVVGPQVRLAMPEPFRPTGHAHGAAA